MKNLKKIGIFLGATVLLTSLVACGNGASKSSNGSSSNKKSDTTTLLMYQVGDKPDNYDELMKIANKRIKDKINVEIDLQYIGWGDWDQKMSTIIASGENYDISFASSYVTNAQKGAYADLTELAPKYAEEAYKALDEDYIKGNTVNGKLYAFPVNGNIYSQQVLTFNKQYLDKYNLSIDGINTYEDASNVLQELHKKEPNIAGFAIGQNYKVSGDYDYPLGKALPFAVKLSEKDSPKIINQYEDPDMMNNLKTMRKWYQEGIIPTDAATDTMNYPLEGNNWFMKEETQGPLDYGDTILTNAAGQELVSKPITTAYRTTITTQVANFVVSNASSNKEKSVEFLGLLNSDPELLNGLVWGVEGEAWEKKADNKISLLDGYKPKKHMSAWNTGNNLILYTQDTISDDLIKERDEKIAKSLSSSLLGFSFYSDKVKTEITNISNIMSRYSDNLNTGSVDPEDNVKKLGLDLDKAGWKKVQQEMQSQLDDFFKEAK